MAFTASTLGVGSPRKIPAPLARLVAGRNAVDAVLRSARSSNTKIKHELAWSPRFPSFREGIPDALAHVTVYCYTVLYYARHDFLHY